MSEKKPQIHRQMTIKHIMSLFPHKAQKLAQEITNAGLHCTSCHAATWETLEAGMASHGFGEEAIEKLLKRLNALLEEQEAEVSGEEAKGIRLTQQAAAKYMEILKEVGKQGWAMRFGDRMAGCSGFEYVLDYSEKPEEDDLVFESHGIQIHINKHAAKRLEGSEIDYVNGLHSSGFKISNPKARSSCGCGSSHNYS
jgi:iron-sulfur cluster assembly accessory protein